MELLKRLYGIHSPSGKEKRMRNFINAYITENVPGARIMVDNTGNLFITKGEAETYPCLAAHLDQVQRYRSQDFRAVETHDIIFGYSPSNRRQEGLGADDKNGIWIALKCLKKYDAVKTAFFIGEEIGCLGSEAADLSFFDDCRFVIEPDRRGFGDIITKISRKHICSEEFLNDMQPEKYGYEAAEGLMTDVEALRDNGLGISCVNISCGYYEPHTDYEFTVKEDLLNCLAFVQHIIENCTKVYTHREEPNFYGFDTETCDWEFEEMVYEIISAHPDYTADEVWDTFNMNFPDVSYEEFIYRFSELRWACDMDTSVPSKPKKKHRKKHRASKPGRQDSKYAADSWSRTYFLGIPKQEGKAG